MPLEWDQVGDKKYQTGVDRGVLYLPERAVVWNGLTSVDEAFDVEVKPYYQDGVKYLNHQVQGDYSGTLKAFTYPDEFDQCVGVVSQGSGLYFHDQRPRPFGLSYRTKIGNDVTEDLGYIIHLLYNLYAVPNSTSFATIGADPTPLEFSWSLTSTPDALSARRPTAHLSIKSTDLDFGVIDLIEGILYGDVENEPHLPSMTSLISTFHFAGGGGGGGGLS